MKYSTLLKNICLIALITNFPNDVKLLKCFNFVVTISKKKMHGHYQFNGAMLLGSSLRSTSLDLANIIKKYIMSSSILSLLFTAVEVIDPGFINFLISLRCLNSGISKQVFDLHHGVAFKKFSRKVIIDYSSPNIAKQLHVGHLRTTIIGDCLSRFFYYKGYNVVSLNHLGDWGTNFGLVMAYIKKFNLKGSFNNITELGDIYQKAKTFSKEDCIFIKDTYKEVLLLQKGDYKTIGIWRLITKSSLQQFNKIYKSLNVRIQVRGESFYNYLLSNIVLYLESKNLVIKSCGSKCVYLQDFFNRLGKPLPIIIEKPIGIYNYNTTDIAAVFHRIFTERGSIVIYITDVGQDLHFKMLFMLARYSGFIRECLPKLEHVSCGLVLKNDGTKLKTRSGYAKKLEMLIQDTVEGVNKMLITRDGYKDEAKRTLFSVYLGVNSVRYNELMTNRSSDYVFNLDRMLTFDGNTLIFVLYSYTRLQSIKRASSRKISTIALCNVYEEELGFYLCRFPCIIDKVIQNRSPHKIVEYLYELSRVFNVFFDNCKIFNSLYEDTRVSLCYAVSNVMYECFFLLGIDPTNRI